MNWFDPLPVRGGSIPFALDAAGRWRDVDEVPRGKACACYCPDCRGPLVARHGDVRVHHFAHSDQRECRHALEASLFGMALEQLSLPGARLALPGQGSRAQWLRDSGLLLKPAHEAKFLANPWVIAPELAVSHAGFETTTGSLREADPARPDLVAPELKLAVHLLSHRKTYEKGLATAFDPSWRVLAVNLGHYIRLWWSACEPANVEKIAEVRTGRSQFAHWLGVEVGGRGYLHHPEEAEMRRRFHEWVERLREKQRLQQEAEARARAAETALRKAEILRWAIPTPTNETSAWPLLYKPVRPDNETVLTQWLAASLHLLPCPQAGTYMFVGRPGQVVPEETRPYLDPDSPWLRLPDDEAPEPARPTVREESGPSEPGHPDRILESHAGLCLQCGAPTERVLVGDGLFRGRIVERCSENPAHPFKVLGRPDTETCAGT